MCLFTRNTELLSSASRDEFILFQMRNDANVFASFLAPNMCAHTHIHTHTHSRVCRVLELDIFVCGQ